MHRATLFMSVVIAGMLLTPALPKADAQVSVGVNIGPEPVCPYGYFETPPYACAPYGYYGPEWFVNGLFIGAGPWFHGPEHFYGHVNTRLHPDHGYRGALPARGERAAPENRLDHVAHFKGNEMHDGHGHKK